MEDDENTTFSDINETSQKSMCVVVIATFMSYCRNWISWQYILLQQKSSIALVLDCIEPTLLQKQL